jgi:gamma-glutamyltranspeptidase / glutathione hydrolase
MRPGQPGRNSTTLDVCVTDAPGHTGWRSTLRAGQVSGMTKKRAAFVLVAISLALLVGAVYFSGQDRRDNLLVRQTEAERMAQDTMVSAAHPLAVEAGLEVLRAGGSAIDAAVAVQMVLGFIEPPETGIGGGGFLLYRSGSTGTMQFYDGREMAPATAAADRFTLFGRPVPQWAAVPSGLSVGVPGLLAMLELAHGEHGRLPWQELFSAAIRHARAGVDMPARLQEQISDDRSLRLFGDMRAYFVAQARLRPPRLANSPLADALELIASQGSAVLYEGQLGRDFIGRARAPRLWPSDLAESDLAGYRVLERAPLCGRYRDWTICGAPPPSSAGIALLQMLGMLEPFALRELGPDSVESLHLIAEASRLAFADRNRYVGDPDHVSIPVRGLIAPQYLRERSALIDRQRAMTAAPPGIPGLVVASPTDTVPPEDETVGTSHFSIVDADGNVVALTSSNESPFGSRMMTNGFLLNNQLTDFNFTPLLPDGTPHPNAPGPGKRPRSSMAPVIVLDSEGNTRLVIGSRGGARIIGYVLKALIGVLDWDLDIQSAIALPNAVHRGTALEIERGTSLERHRGALESLGHHVSVTRLTSGLHGIERTAEAWRGGADPRMEGVAIGD